MPKKKLSELLLEAAENTKQTISETKWAELEKQVNAPHNAENKRSVTCPHCGGDFDVSWKTSEETSETKNDDDSNDRLTDGKVREGMDGRAIDRLNALARSLKEEANKQR